MTMAAGWTGTMGTEWPRFAIVPASFPRGFVWQPHVCHGSGPEHGRWPTHRLGLHGMRALWHATRAPPLIVV